MFAREAPTLGSAGRWSANRTDSSPRRACSRRRPAGDIWGVRTRTKKRCALFGGQPKRTGQRPVLPRSALSR